MNDERSDTREAILAAATDEFARRGLKGARVRAIVQAAGVNERMLYHHFGSKEGLYQAVLASVWTSPDLRSALHAHAALPPYEGFRALLVELFAWFQARPAVLPLVIHEWLTGWEHLPPASLDRLPPELSALFARGQQEGVFRSDVAFETFYLTALGALVSIGTVGNRFEDLRERMRTDPAAAFALRDRVIDLVFHGACVPTERRTG